MANVRSNSACLLVGKTGTGKSSLIATLADKVWQEHKKKTLYYLADGGGFGTQIEVLIKRGIVWVWKMRTRGEAFETCARASQGWWPKDWNKLTGETLPGCKLLKPITTRHELYCSCGKLVNIQPKKEFLTKKMVSCECGKLINSTSDGVEVKDITIRTPGFEDVGAVAFDGLTSMQQWVMDNLAERTANGTLKGEATGLGGVIMEGDYAAGGNNRAHYGFAQSRGESWILDSTAIPSTVAPPIWTALEERGQMSDTKVAVYGPKLAGGAKTSIAPQWVGNCLSLEIRQDKENRNVHRLHLQEWMDDDGTPHLCKNRALPGMLPPYLEDVYKEDGTVNNFENFSLGKFFDLLDEAFVKADKQAEDIYADAPGLPVGSIGFDEEEEDEDTAKVVPPTAKPTKPVAPAILKAKSATKKPGIRGAVRG
jgi:hypothetical protein